MLVLQPLKRDSLTYHRSVGCNTLLRFGVLNAQPEFCDTPMWLGMSVLGGRYYTANCGLIKIRQETVVHSEVTEMCHWCVQADGYLFPYRTSILTPWARYSWCYPAMLNTIRYDLKARIAQSTDSIFDTSRLMLLSGRYSNDDRTQCILDTVEDTLTELRIDRSLCTTDLYHENDVYKHLHQYSSDFSTLLCASDTSAMSDPVIDFVVKHHRPAINVASRQVINAGIAGNPMAMSVLARQVSCVIDHVHPLRCEGDQLPGWQSYRGDIMSVLARLPVDDVDVWYHYRGTDQYRPQPHPDLGNIRWPSVLSTESRLAAQYQLACLTSIFYVVWTNTRPEYPNVRLGLRLSPGDEILITIRSDDGHSLYGSYYVDAAYEYLSPINLGSLPIVN